MLTSEVDFAFPVLGFTPDKEIWGFPDLNRLTRCGPSTVPQGRQIGMELVDAKGRRWIVRAVERVGPAEPFFKNLLNALLSTPQTRIVQHLDTAEPLSIAAVQDKACASLEAFPEDYALYEPEDLAAMLAKVRKTRSVKALFELLTPDTFEAY